MVGGIELTIDEITEQAVDLGGLEASDLNIEAALRQQVSKLAQLSGKQLVVPPRVQRNFVVGQRQRALLGLAQIRQRHYRDVRQSKLERRQVATVPRKDRPVLVGKDRVSPAKPLDAVDDLFDLLLWVGPRISRMGAKIADRIQTSRMGSYRKPLKPNSNHATKEGFAPPLKVGSFSRT